MIMQNQAILVEVLRELSQGRTSADEAERLLRLFRSRKE
jgi:hypothetical protein